jgi:pimeloyl-ACP methyl ester carboxylesterase
VTVREVAKAVDRALEERKVEGAVLVGHSYGGWVALEEAVAKPKRAAAVVVLDIASYTPPDSARIASLTQFLADRYPALIRVIFEDLSVDPIEGDSAAAHALRVPQEVMAGYLRDSWHGDMRSRIKGLKTPVELIATDASWPPSLSWEAAKGRFAYETAGPFRAHRVFASGHLVMRDRPDTLAVILDDIARRVPR